MDGLEARLAGLEFRRMFQGDMDGANCFLEIQSGSGGTEAQDWADMLLRMYLRWAKKRQFTARVTELSPGDVAGFKSATVEISGEYAYGWLRTETGVHRLGFVNRLLTLESSAHVVCVGIYRPRN
ncbi:MAG: hypothetical protein CM15mP120_21600 [Pseudomonadota bacterium]|nr:MAG: hypothetical protein CM15mP120_21600 [Pseudomonadota bacterium]